MPRTDAMSPPRNATRREFLKQASLFGLTGVAAPLALDLAAIGSAAAQTAAGAAADDYKALVCVFLYGGNDPYNTVVPYDAASYEKYARNRTDIGLKRDALQATALTSKVALPDGQQYALAPTLAPLKPLFDSGRLAIQLNVGPLIVPTVKEQYVGNKVPLPPKLFSHNDQQSYWQALAPEGAGSGWGGRLADALLDGNKGSTFTAVTAGGSTVLLAGRHTAAYRVTPAGSTQIDLLHRDMYGSTDCTNLLRTLITQSQQHMFGQEHVAIVNRSIDADKTLRAALQGVDVAGDFGTPLGGQLQIVARMIAARKTLGVKRQVFFVSQNGYDNHDGLNGIHPGLLKELGGALAAFQQALATLGVEGQVTTFTASEFGRTLTSNGNGSDHGWGSHHFIIGGAVRGGRFYGTHPDIAPNGPGFVDNGRLLPTTSVEQFAATIGLWFGASAGALDDVLPNLHNFDHRDLAFMNSTQRTA
jgi:uncharacterized protein (DUF1501 family)